MKRTRDDMGPGGPLHKRPASGPGRGMGLPSLGVPKLTTNDALSYLRDVKKKFEDNKEVYDKFLEIMKEFKAQRTTTEGVIEQVKTLFKGHRELILGFNTFLPKGYEITLAEELEEPKQAVEFDQAISYVNKIKTRFSSEERVYKAFLEILNMYRKGHKSINNVYEEVAMLFRAHRDLLEEFTYFLPDSSPPQAGGAPKMTRILHRPTGPVKPAMRPGPDPVLLQRKVHQRKSARRADELIRRQQGAEEEEERRGPPKPNLAKEMTFFDKVKNRVRGRDNYQDFLKALNLFAQEIISKQELTLIMQELLARYPDLVGAFTDFLGRCENTDYEIGAAMLQAGKLSKHDLKLKGDRFMTRPVSELDVTSWTRATTSYVHLPANYPRLLCSARMRSSDNRSLDKLLNDIWVSVTSGSEDYSFKHMRKNQYEEHLFRCEDDRFELDMCIECNASAWRAMQALEAQLAQMDGEERASFRIPEKALNAIHYRSIQKIYGEQGAHIVGLLKQNPAVAVGVITPRLREKDAEWRKQKQSMGKMWQKVYEANYHKSLDHRSFYFKQTDKKNLGAKAMMQEVKDIMERRRGEDSLHSLSTQKLASLRAPDLTFEYRDQIVHNDVFKVIKLGVEEICTPEQGVKVMDFWVSVVEPFFGLPARAPEEIKVAAVADSDGGVRAAKEENGRPAPGRMAKKKTFKLAEDNGAADSEPGSAAIDGDDSGDGDAARDTASAPRRVKGSAARASDTPEVGEADETEVEDQGLTDQDQADSEDQEDGDVPAQRSADDDLLDMVDETAPERTFIHCKPLAPADAVRKAHTTADGPQTSASRVIYGNETFYVFFRLHHYLYDRLRQAIKCSADKVEQGKGRSVFPALGGEADTVAGPLAPLSREAEQIHQEFMGLVEALIGSDNDMDVGAFEDATRALLGTSSYMLFTLDKLIYKLVKQLQSICTDEVSARLADVHRYEIARTLPFIDAVYAANVHVLLGEDNMFRFECRGDNSLAVLLMEPDRSEIVPSVLDAGFGEYLKLFTDSPANLDLIFGGEVRAVRQPFLRRSLPKELRSGDIEAAAMDVLANACVVNGLECKLSTSTSKVSYVLDTEDIFIRNKKRRRLASEGEQAQAQERERQHAQEQHERFQQWVTQRALEIQNEPPTVVAPRSPEPVHEELLDAADIVGSLHAGREEEHSMDEESEGDEQDL